MSYPYNTQGTPAVGGGLPGLPQRAAARAGVGTYVLDILAVESSNPQVVVPPGVGTVCAVVIAPGASTATLTTVTGTAGGRGADLRWANDIPVSAGDVLTLLVNITTASLAINGVVVLAATNSGAGSTPLGAHALGFIVGGGDGGAGGAAGSSSTAGGAGGGGAGGYLGNGGTGGGRTNATRQAAGGGLSAASGGNGNPETSVADGSVYPGAWGGSVGPYGVLSDPPLTGAPPANISAVGNQGNNGEGLVVQTAARGFGGGAPSASPSSKGTTGLIGRPGCLRVFSGASRSFPYNAGPIT